MTRSEAMRNLLNTPEFHTEMNNMKEDQMNLIINSNDDQVATREVAYLRIKTINEIMARFDSIANDARVKDSAWKIL